jgi:hypothetical protein
MTRYNDILNGIKQGLDNTEAAQKTYKGQKRSDLKDSDFLFPETRSFPIVSPVDIPDAISNFGRMKGQMSYDAFLKKLYNFAKKKGPEFVAALPKATKDKLGLKISKADCDVENISHSCETQNAVNKGGCGCSPATIDTETPQDKLYPENVYQADRLNLLSQDEDEDEEEMIEEITEYKQEYYEMSVGSIKSIMTHAYNILKAIDNPAVKNSLTETWLQGKIAVTEDYMITIHNFVMFGHSETDTESSDQSEEKKN